MLRIRNDSVIFKFIIITLKVIELNNDRFCELIETFTNIAEPKLFSLKCTHLDPKFRRQFYRHRFAVVQSEICRSF